jgi:CubicO group peptidase (beta-lactamase class C family)
MPAGSRAATRLARLLCYISLLACLLLPACAQSPSELGLVDAGGLESFADGFFARHMRKLHIPGLVFVVVQDGDVLLAKGYGKASIEEDRPVEPVSTVFRIGSISKLFVAVAVMQMVERGQLDLHTDVNQYLTDFQVQNPYPTALTLEHLLTHTGGIQDPPYESNVDPDDRLPLGEFLATELPPATSAPGEQFAYSSNGYALAAYVVQEVTGMPFDLYVQENIAKTLGMLDTCYLLSPPAPEGMAMGYAYQGGSYVPQPLDYDDDYPGGEIVSTAQDMAVFATALLEGGCYGSTCILQPRTLEHMRRTTVEVPGGPLRQGLGFVKGEIRGQEVLGHTGAIRGFGASLDTFPDHDAAYFLAFNAECWASSACEIIPEFRQEFVERFPR